MNRRLTRATLSVLPMLCLALLPAAPASAQARPGTQPLVMHNPTVNLPVHFDVSPPLRDMVKTAVPQIGFHQASPPLRPKLHLLESLAGRPAAADPVLQTYSGPNVGATIGLNLLGVGNGFPNYTVPDAPSDVNLAVGDTQVVQWVNVSYAVFDKATGATILGPVLGNAFWSGFGGACQNDNSGDPIIQWDKMNHRWVAAQNVFVSPYMTCIAVSQTSDATGAYFRFAYTQPGFPDYPKWGIMPQAYFQSQNDFGPSGAAYLGVNACAYESAKLLVGDSSAKQICFLDTSNGTLFDDSMLPGDLDSASNPPPSTQDEVYVGSIDNGPSFLQVYEYLFHVDFTVPANSTFTGENGTMPIPGVSSFGLLCGGFSACITQKNTSSLLDSLGDRLMYRLAYRGFSDHQSWLVSHSVTAGTSGGERWYEFQAPVGSTALTTFQQGTFAPDSSYRWMGSLAMDQNQDIALGYSVSDSNTFPAIRFTGRVPSDPLGTMETESSIVEGTGSQTDTSNRWGDYTSMAIDAADDCTFWYTNQYYMVTTSFDWSTRLASLKFTGCGATVGDYTVTAIPGSRTITAGTQTTYKVTVTPSGGFNGTVNLTISGLPSPSRGTFIPASLPVSTGPANSKLSIGTSKNTPTGTYSLTITATSGTISHTTTVSLTIN